MPSTEAIGFLGSDLRGSGDPAFYIGHPEKAVQGSFAAFAGCIEKSLATWRGAAIGGRKPSSR
jgi:hypothetical protein